MAVYFYDSVADGLLRFAVIIAKYNGKLLFCKHRPGTHWKLPAATDPGEPLRQAARRELQEETGAIDFTLAPSVSTPWRNPAISTGGKLSGCCIWQTSKPLTLYCT